MIDDKAHKIGTIRYVHGKEPEILTESGWVQCQTNRYRILNKNHCPVHGDVQKPMWLNTREYCPECCIDYLKARNTMLEEYFAKEVCSWSNCKLIHEHITRKEVLDLLPKEEE